MAATTADMLSPDDLNDADRTILDELHDGRATPSLIADRTGVDRSYANQRLKRLVEHNHVRKLAAGLYELVEDPRESTDEGPADLGVLQKTSAVDTEDGRRLLLETDEGEFLLAATEKPVVDGLSVVLDSYRDDVVFGET